MANVNEFGHRSDCMSGQPIWNCACASDHAAPGSGRFDRPLTAGPVIVGGYKLDGDSVSSDFSRAVDLHAAALEFVDADRAWVLAVSASVDGGAGAAAFDAATVARDAARARLLSESHVYAIGVRRFDPVLAVALAEVGDARAAKRAAAPAPARVVCPVCSLSLAADGSCGFCSSAETRALGRSVAK